MDENYTGEEKAHAQGWLDSEKISNSDRHVYMRENDLDGLPLEFSNFLDFYEARKSRMLIRLKSVLGISSKID